MKLYAPGKYYFLHSKTQEVLDFEKTLSKVKSDQNLRKVLDRHEEGRDRWKRRNPDYKKKKYVIYIYLKKKRAVSCVSLYKVVRTRKILIP
jgi:hypothetical protein